MNREKTLLALLETHGDVLWRIARAYAASVGETDDLHQEILAQVWRSLPSFRGDSKAATWLYRVAVNTALTWQRRMKRHDNGQVPLEPVLERNGAVTGGSARSEAAILRDFLQTLKGPDHTVILLYMEGLSYQQIADVTGLSVSLVGVRIHRMKQAFTDRYVEQ